MQCGKAQEEVALVDTAFVPRRDLILINFLLHPRNRKAAIQIPTNTLVSEEGL